MNIGDQLHLLDEKGRADPPRHVIATDTEKDATRLPIVTEGRLPEEIVVDQGKKNYLQSHSTVFIQPKLYYLLMLKTIILSPQRLYF